jgi:hypothetical protein
MLLFLLPLIQVVASEKVTVSKVSPNFIFDGIVNEDEWSSVPALTLTVQTPIYHGEPSQRSIIKLSYDENYIYLAGALYDSEPEKILHN